VGGMSSLISAATIRIRLGLMDPVDFRLQPRRPEWGDFRISGRTTETLVAALTQLARNPDKKVFLVFADQGMAKQMLQVVQNYAQQLGLDARNVQTVSDSRHVRGTNPEQVFTDHVVLGFL